MSHTTEISAIVFSDMAALAGAVAELQKMGVKCALERNATPRAFFQNQKGMEAADYVLRLADCPYDIGFYKTENGRGYSARTDLWGGHVQRVLGVNARPGETAEQAALGKLNQMYGVHAATREAARKGYRVQRINKEDGTIALKMTGMQGS